jgi:Zn-finger nucleic acid-binding protein
MACPNCGSQYDVTGRSEASFACRCGTMLTPDLGPEPQPVDVEVHRCGACGAGVAATDRACAYCSQEIVRDPRRLGLICPACYARSPEDTRFCTACGIPIRPQPIPDGDHPAFVCPACDHDLSHRAVGAVWLDECAGCGGLWVGDEDFDLLVNRAAEAARQRPTMGLGTDHRRRRKTEFQTDVRYRRCPDCEGVMQRRNFGKSSGIIVDWCGRHGSWLDADELEDIADFIVKGGLVASAGPVRGPDADPTPPNWTELTELKRRAVNADDDPHRPRRPSSAPTNDEIRESFVTFVKDLLGLA